MEYLVLFPDGRSFGPADVPTLADWAKQGRLLPETLLESLGTRERVPAGSVAGIFPVGTQVGSTEQSAAYPRYYTNPQGYAQSTSGLAVAALVFGIISLVSLCFWPISIPCGLLAVVFGLVARTTNSKSLAMAGLVLGLCGMLFSILLIVSILAGMWSLFNR